MTPARHSTTFFTCYLPKGRSIFSVQKFCQDFRSQLERINSPSSKPSSQEETLATTVVLQQEQPIITPHHHAYLVVCNFQAPRLCLMSNKRQKIDSSSILCGFEIQELHYNSCEQNRQIFPNVLIVELRMDQIVTLQTNAKLQLTR